MVERCTCNAKVASSILARGRSFSGNFFLVFFSHFWAGERLFACAVEYPQDQYYKVVFSGNQKLPLQILNVSLCPRISVAWFLSRYIARRVRKRKEETLEINKGDKTWENEVKVGCVVDR